MVQKEAVEQADRMRRKVLEAALTELSGPPSKENTTNILCGVAWALAELTALAAKDYTEALLLLYALLDQEHEFLYQKLAPPGMEPALKDDTEEVGYESDRAEDPDQ